MSTEAATETVTNGDKKKRGAPPGPRGPRQWNETPTKRESVMNRSLAEAIKEHTGVDVDIEVIRAVRFALPKWQASDEFQTKKNNIKKEIQREKALEQKKKALEMLRKAEAELESDEFDEEEAEEDSEEDSEDEEFVDEDVDDDDSDDDDEDVFSESDSEKKSVSF